MRFFVSKDFDIDPQFTLIENVHWFRILNYFDDLTEHCIFILKDHLREAVVYDMD